MPDKLAFDPDKILTGPRTPRPDAAVVVDCANFERMGAICDSISKRGPLINIDHHGSNTRYGDINWIDAQSASSGELIYRLLKQANGPSPRPLPIVFSPPSAPYRQFSIPHHATLHLPRRRRAGESRGQSRADLRGSVPELSLVA